MCVSITRCASSYIYIKYFVRSDIYLYISVEEATLLPQVYASTNDVRERRARMEEALARLLSESPQLSMDSSMDAMMLPTEMEVRPPFYLVYQGYNDCIVMVSKKDKTIDIGCI